MATESNTDYQEECLDKACKRIEKALKPHAQRVKNYDRNEKAYKGIVEGVRSGRWNHQVYPPYIFEVIETMESGLIDDATVLDIRPNKDGEQEGADALEHILAQQADEAKLDIEKGAFTKSCLVYGIGVMKTQWRYQRGPQTRRNWDENGKETDPITEQVTHFDGPMSTNLDPRDFMWDTTATSMDNAEYVIYRYWASKDFVKSMGRADEGEEPVWMNVKDALESRSNKEPASGKSLDKSKPDVSHEGQYEIFEVWTRDRLVVVCNQSVLVQDDPSPFWHNELPFQVGMTLTDLNRFEGQSEVTVLIALQNALWDILNQTLDNVELANNGIVMFSDTVDNTDAFQFFPGAKWIVENAQTDVRMWEPNTRVLNSSQGITESLKGDLQSLAAALPYLAGAGGDQIDQNTATGISIISNMAQRRILRKKALLGYSYKALGKQWVSLNQQFLPGPKAVRIDGPGGYAFKHVTPQEIQGQYDFCVENQTENLDRQQKRQEALDLFQQLMPWYQQLGLDPKALAEKVFSAWDIRNSDQYFIQQAAPQQQVAPQGLQLPPQSLNGTPDPNAVYQSPAVAATTPLTPPAQ